MPHLRLVRDRSAFSFSGVRGHALYDVRRRILDPQPDDATLVTIYTSDYFFARDGEEDRERHARLKAASAQRTLDLLPSPAPGTRLLDVGCGTGDFLIQARARGYVVSGVEYSPSSAATEPFDGRPLRKLSAYLPDTIRHGPFPIIVSGITAVAQTEHM